MLLATALWLPAVRLLFPAPERERDALREGLHARQRALWDDPAAREGSIERMRLANGEWDFMARTFFVLSLANRALERPAERDALVATMDRILDETLRLEAARGQAHFLLPYVHDRPFVDASGRSVFVDGEIALMMAARERVARTPRFAAPLRERVEAIVAQMERGPALSAESYPDECWTFCNTLALAAVRLHDDASGEDHSAFLRRWVAHAKANLVDPETGLLVSSYTRDGRFLDGPEGSSIFMVAHALELVDPAFARDQYARARAELGRDALGFRFAREWPASWQGPTDIDSGPIVPLFEASAGASGMYVLGAEAFDDADARRGLYRSLALAAFPEDDGRGARYLASNQVGDAILLYALSQGPLWERVGPPAEPLALRVPGPRARHASNGHLHTDSAPNPPRPQPGPRPPGPRPPGPRPPGP